MNAAISCGAMISLISMSLKITKTIPMNAGKYANQNLTPFTHNAPI
jgi:hypothetical protein